MPADSHSVVDRDGAYAEWFRQLRADVIVVRPDFYTFGASSDAAVSDLLDSLERQLWLT